jgi:hypothetical protein
VDSQPDILRYQRDRSLADVPGFSVGLQLRLPDDTKVYLALAPACCPTDEFPFESVCGKWCSGASAKRRFGV